jgi:hypothetical protein
MHLLALTRSHKLEGVGSETNWVRLFDFSMVRRGVLASINRVRSATIEVGMPVTQGIHSWVWTARRRRVFSFPAAESLMLAGHHNGVTRAPRFRGNANC